MNYLAHLYLAEDTRDSLVGNLLGDFARGVSLERQPEGVLAGFRNHHRIDRLTDAHPAVRELRGLFFLPLRHYSSVVLDVLFDHVLATRWEEWSPWPLERFASYVYRTLGSASRLPEGRMRDVLPRMVERGFLTAYAHREGVEGVLGSLERRTRRPVPLRGVLERYEEYEPRLRKGFDELFPRLVEATEDTLGGPPPWRRV